MALLKIARMGHPVLLQRCEPVPNPGGPGIRQLVANMMQTMEDASGVGLAAPQVHVPLRLFVFRIPAGRGGDDPDDQPVGNSVLINPELELLGEERVLGWEGCLSIPGLRAGVPRSPRVRYRGVDCDGNVITDSSNVHGSLTQGSDNHPVGDPPIDIYQTIIGALGSSYSSFDSYAAPVQGIFIACGVPEGETTLAVTYTGSGSDLAFLPVDVLSIGSAATEVAAQPGY